ncbi:hypothetical protein Tco_0807775 [Tanacetum coccineum]
MASLKYCNKHNQVGFLNKNLKNLESAGVCRDSRLLQKAWHIRYTITEASVRSQADQAGTQSQPSSSTVPPPPTSQPAPLNHHHFHYTIN